MKTTARLLHLMLPYWRWILLSIALSTATIASGIGLIGTSTYLISKASMQPSIAVLQVAIVGVRFFGISRGIFRYLERLVSHGVNLRILSKLRRWLYEKLEPLSPAIYQSHQSGDLLSQATADIDLLENFFVRVLSPILVAVLITSGMGVFIGIFQWKLALILVAGLLVSGMFIPLSSTLFRMRGDENLSQQRGEMSGAITETIQGLRDILAYNQENIKNNKISEMMDQLESTQNKIALGESLIETLSQLLPHLTLFVVIIVAVPLIEQGNLEDIMLGVIGLMLLASFEAVQPLGKTAQNLEQSLQAANRLFALSEIKPEVESLPSPENLSLNPSIRFNNLTFSYPGSDYPALNKISFLLNKGEKVGLIGPSGAGKSTIFNLLFRFWDIQPGKILLDDEDIRSLDPDGVRRLFAVVSQDSTFLAGSLRKNLLLANPTAKDEQLNHVLQQVNLDSWVGQLPNKLDTWIGEHGIKMSGGEFTRLLIARAMLRSAPIWILDEPTAHLDAVNENNITQLLHKVTKNKTTIWATHNLFGKENLDQIFVFDMGCIIERGNHQDLLNLQGSYFKYWENKAVLP